MSSSRSVASARARRAGGDGSSRPSQLRTQPGFSKQPPAMPTPQTTQQEEPSQKDSRLSVSDAFALVTIRLGRVEMALQKLDIHNLAEKLANGEGSESIASNVIVKSIASRIDDLEKSIQDNVGSSITPEQLEIVNGVQDKVSSLEKEMFQLKDHIYKLQSFALDVNQKIAELKESSLSSPKDSKSVSSAEQEVDEEEEEEDEDEEG